MARTEPNYKRNRPHLCSFFARGECKRGDACPYLHEMPTDKKDPLANQNIVDRFHGKNDPVANKILASHAKKEGKAPVSKKRRTVPPPPPPPPSEPPTS